ncbi:MAG: discoidin domain-containing protein [Leptospiraceae bacterium]|nr:discoidin domain-containing protein [Leptospiraceae bacterium]MCK6380898.1 discoidin domain-containing protein [Leptospiraceae bacterium]NUM40047.1 discoidin domain-containing protein [Leptospiraceae bacterium]
MPDTSIRISHSQLQKIQKITAKGKYKLHEGVLESYIEDSENPDNSVVIFNFSEEVYFNSIQFSITENDKKYSPHFFRFEISKDGIVWEPIIQEVDFRKNAKSNNIWTFSLVSANYIKFISKLNLSSEEKKYKISFSNLKIMISGAVKLTASSENDRLWVKENLIDGRKDYGWSSKEKDSPGEESFTLDLGSVNKINELRLLTRNSTETNFPEHFSLFYSEDDLSWFQLMEEPKFFSEPGMWYRWRFLPVNFRFLKFVSYEELRHNKKQYVSQVVEIELYAAPDFIDLSKKEKAEPLPYASILRSGLVRFATEGEAKSGVAVQASDPRLRDATIEFKGIVELASDGEEKPGVVVQGNDKRLKPATDEFRGLVRFAKNGETRTGTAVQGDDDRLKPATTSDYGIVKLAEDGETRSGVVVQGNDNRLKKATKKNYGLVVLADHEESSPEKVVTSDDPRIKNANTEKTGILRFASNGEDSSFAAVQGNDNRLKKATTESYGIVELASDGEAKPEKVVQGNDRRLKLATTNEPGIVLLSEHGSTTSNKVVIADDPRLCDKREPVPHTHEYSMIGHDFNSHSGLIKLNGKESNQQKSIVSPSINQGVIFGKNESEQGSGIVGVGGEEGVLGFSPHYGVSGYSNGKENSAGVLGVSHFSHGAIFISQREYALFANGNGLKSKDIQGSGKAILAEGDSLFKGLVQIQTKNGNDCIARYFPIVKGDVIAEGDLLVTSSEEGRLSKSKTAYSTRVIGVAIQSESLVLGEKIENSMAVGMFGVVRLNVDASDGEIVPGDILVSSISPGHAVKADLNKTKIGMIVGKSLGYCKKGKSTIQAMVSIG